MNFAQTLDVKQLIVTCNKMDTTEPPFSGDRYSHVKTEGSKSVKKFSYNPKAVAVVPISGFNGDNMLESSPNMASFTGWNIETKEGEASGKTLLEALDTILPTSRAVDQSVKVSPIKSVSPMKIKEE